MTFGAATAAAVTLAWDLTYVGGGEPLLFLPERLCTAPLPKAKAVTPQPNVVFAGTFAGVSVDGWTGSENHNWGSKYTDTHAWGQVAGLDDAPDAFLEALTARSRSGRCGHLGRPSSPSASTARSTGSALCAGEGHGSTSSGGSPPALGVSR